MILFAKVLAWLVFGLGVFTTVLDLILVATEKHQPSADRVIGFFVGAITIFALVVAT